MRARGGTSAWFTRLVGSLLAAAPLPVAAEFLDPRMVERAEEADAADEGAYDPLSGMDETGRIPAILRPEKLKHPDRWRYLPEGRLKPGSVLDRFLVSSFITPYVFSSRDVGTGVGLAISDVDFRQQRRQERSALLLSYTSEGQGEYRIKWRRWLHHMELPAGGILYLGPWQCDCNLSLIGNVAKCSAGEFRFDYVAKDKDRLVRGDGKIDAVAEFA